MIPTRLKWLGVFSLTIALLLLSFWAQNNDESIVNSKQSNLWYNLYWNKQKVGYFQQKWSHDFDRLVWTQSLTIAGNTRGKRYTHSSIQQLEFSKNKPYGLIRGFEKTLENGRSHLKRFSVKGNQLIVKNNLKPIVKPYANIFTAYEQLYTPPSIENMSGETHVTLKRWDMEALEINSYQLKPITRLGSDSIWEATEGDEGIASSWVIDDFGRVKSRHLKQQLSYQLTNKTNAIKMNRKIHLNRHPYISLNKPLGKISDISELSLMLSGKQTNIIKRYRDEPYLEMGEYQTEPVKEALDISSISKIDQLMLKKILSGQLDDNMSDEDKIHKLVHFVSDYVKDSVNLHSPSLDALLKDPRGDCTEHSLLFVNLVRVLGIPSKMVNGLIYLGDKQQKYQAHVWAEVYLNNKWHAVDPTWERTQLDLSYIRFNMKNADTFVSLLATSGRFLTVKTLNHSY